MTSNQQISDYDGARFLNFEIEPPYSVFRQQVLDNRASYSEIQQRNIANFFLADAAYYIWSFARSGQLLATAALHGAVHKTQL